MKKNLFNACAWVIYDYDYDNTPLEGIKYIMDYYTQDSFLRHFINVRESRRIYTVFYEITGNQFAVRYVWNKYYNFLMNNYMAYSEMRSSY